MILKQEIKLILISCLSLLFIAFFATFTVFFMESKQEEQLPFTLTLDEYVPVFISVSLFVVYPILVVAFVTPFVILKHYNVNMWLRVLVYLVAGVIIMLIPTFLNRYGFIYVVIALLFGLFDFIWSRIDTSLD